MKCGTKVPLKNDVKIFCELFLREWKIILNGGFMIRKKNYKIGILYKYM